MSALSDSVRSFLTPRYCRSTLIGSRGFLGDLTSWYKSVGGFAQLNFPSSFKEAPGVGLCFTPSSHTRSMENIPFNALVHMLIRRDEVNKLVWRTSSYIHIHFLLLCWTSWGLEELADSGSGCWRKYNCGCALPNTMDQRHFRTGVTDIGLWWWACGDQL